MEQLGPYRLVRQLAVGGMAEVYLAKTVGVAGFEKFVALKMIHPGLAENQEFITMLVDEAKIAVQLSHPNIAQTLDLGRDGDTYYLAMEYVDGIDLFNLIRATAHIGFMMPFDAVAFIAREIANALDHAHTKCDAHGNSLGVVHRDVSPDNILISHEGAVKLVDFGIAKAAARGSQTAIGTIKGKFSYMSPEMALGEPVDATADIYSAGVCLYEMLTGRPLYVEDDPSRLLDLVRGGAFVAPSHMRTDIPPELERIVMKALAKQRHRYQSTRDLANDLQQFMLDYSPLFGNTTLASLVGVVLERAGVKPTTPARGSEPPQPAPVIERPEPSWSSALTNPYTKRQQSPRLFPRATQAPIPAALAPKTLIGVPSGGHTGPARPRRADSFEELFDDLFSDLEAYDEPDVQFAVEDPSKQIVIRFDPPPSDD